MPQTRVAKHVFVVFDLYDVHVTERCWSHGDNVGGFSGETGPITLRPPRSTDRTPGESMGTIAPVPSLPYDANRYKLSTRNADTLYKGRPTWFSYTIHRQTSPSAPPVAMKRPSGDAAMTAAPFWCASRVSSGERVFGSPRSTVEGTPFSGSAGNTCEQECTNQERERERELETLQ